MKKMVAELKERKWFGPIEENELDIKIITTFDVFYVLEKRPLVLIINKDIILSDEFLAELSIRRIRIKRTREISIELGILITLKEFTENFQGKINKAILSSV